ncbi:hypothetical protein F1188_18275 [Roseospira marina]|uniref:Uncharacterized protein n=1 Tax=Roseospira marina TaxID=140057 RepID=A0A5M6I8C9_9PROT|nr:hypothetical protein [Roseospira marina]KAA5603968.1 hypothetical protein F1188_18275 [Roseospira marina]MBB4315938.1 hypothetical protein [Roseospira marina]MBB5089101.1 hypothetical protein [Roseospira marina]
MTGFLALSRSYLDHPVVGLHTPEWFAAWVWMLAEAAWAPRQVRVGRQRVTLEPGQFSHSVRFMAQAVGWTPSRMADFLARLEDAGLIARAPVQPPAENRTDARTGGRTEQRVITILDDTLFPDGVGAVRTEAQTEDRTGIRQSPDKQRTIQQDSSPPPSARGREDDPPDPIPNSVADSSAEAAPTFALEPPPGPGPVDRMAEAWNGMARDVGLPLVRSVTPKRRAAAERWLRDFGGGSVGGGGGLSAWALLLDRIRASPVLTGQTGRMRADVDFALDPHTTTRILEGSYDAITPGPHGGGGPRLVARDGTPVGRGRGGSPRAPRDDIDARIARLLEHGNDAAAGGAGGVAGQRPVAGDGDGGGG